MSLYILCHLSQLSHYYQRRHRETLWLQSVEYIKDDEDENQCKVSLPDKYVIFEIKYFDSYDEFEEFRAILG